MSKNTDRIQCPCPTASTAGCKVSKPQWEALYAFIYICLFASTRLSSEDDCFKVGMRVVICRT